MTRRTARWALAHLPAPIQWARRAALPSQLLDPTRLAMAHERSLSMAESASRSHCNILASPEAFNRIPMRSSVDTVLSRQARNLSLPLMG